MRLTFLKSLILSMVALLVSPLAMADSCSDPSRQQDVCREMKHLRSQILVLGAERDLMQINYNLLDQVGQEIVSGAGRALNNISLSDENHAGGLIGVQAIAMDLREQAKNKSGEALITANKIQQQCATCHSSAQSTSGHSWDDIFKSDWSVFYKKCNSPERNPYRCKSMHGMFSYYSGFFTAQQLGIKNYELTELEAKRITSIAADLRANNLVHGLEDLIGKTAIDAAEVAQLAAQKNPEAFDRALALTQTCMKCHADRSPARLYSALKLDALKN